MSTKNVSGIYLIKNVINNKVYIGQSINIERRINDHKKLLKGNRHDNKHLQSAWNKNGKESFSFEILEECPIDELNSKEKYYIELFNSLNPKIGYNLLEVPETSYGASPSWAGRQKISNSNKGRKHTEETKKKISLAKMGNPSRKGQRNSDEVCQQIKERMMGNKIWVGRKHSEETKRKMSELARGRKPSDRKNN